MNKKILSISIAILFMAVMICACDDDDKKSNAASKINPPAPVALHGIWQGELDEDSTSVKGGGEITSGECEYIVFSASGLQCYEYFEKTAFLNGWTGTIAGGNPGAGPHAAADWDGLWIDNEMLMVTKTYIQATATTGSIIFTFGTESKTMTYSVDGDTLSIVSEEDGKSEIQVYKKLTALPATPKTPFWGEEDDED